MDRRIHLAYVSRYITDLSKYICNSIVVKEGIGVFKKYQSILKSLIFDETRLLIPKVLWYFIYF